MGGPVLKEPGGEPEKLTTEIQKQEAQLSRILGGLPPRASTPTQLLVPVKNAEDQVRGLVELAKSIDLLFGRSANGELADIQKEVSRLRAQLGVTGQQVAGVNRRYGSQAELINTELGRVETALGKKNLGEAVNAFDVAKKHVEMLSEVIGAARGLFAAGAPQELVNAADRALELFNKGESERARLVLNAMATFMDNREYFTTDAGKPGVASLVRFVQAVSDETQLLDAGKAGKGLSDFTNGLAYPQEQGAADRKYVAEAGAVLGAATAEKIAATLDTLLNEGEAGRAKILAGIALTYIEMARKWKDAQGLDVMKAALVRYADTGAQEAADQFGEVAMRLAFSSDVEKLSGTVASWSEGAQKNVAQKALEKIRTLLDEKKYGEGGTLLTYTAMYAESVAALGLAKRPAPQLGAGIVTGLSSMASALGAFERGESEVDGRDARKLFMESQDETIRGARAMALQRGFSTIKNKFNGSVSWAEGIKPGFLPMGDRQADDTYPGMIEISKLRQYEKSGDAALKGQALDQLLTACGRAAQNGDAETYAASIEALTKRLALVASRYLTGQMADGIMQMADALDSIKKAYSGGCPRDAGLRLTDLYENMHEFSAMLKSGTKMSDTLPALKYNALCNAFKREQALGMIANQAEVNAGYAKMAMGITGSMAGISLRESGVHLENARKALLDGDNALARKEYGRAMENRQDALALFSAMGKEKKFGGGSAVHMFDAWRRTHMEIFDGVMAGRDTAKLQESAGFVELSVFALPENARGFVDFSTGQKNIRELALAGKTKEAQAEWDRMQKALQAQKLWTNIAKTVAGVAIGFVPGGQIASGAIFVSMAANQAIDEAAVGRVSDMTVIMFAVSVATWGLGGVINELRMAAEVAKAAGRVNAAVAYGRGATALMAAGFGTGVGMTALSIPATIEAYKEGRFGEVTFNVAMALFPFAHMGTSYAKGKMDAARGRTVVTFEQFVEDIRAVSRTAVVKPVPVKIAAPGEVVRPVVAEKIPETAVKKGPPRTAEDVYENYMKTGMLPENLAPKEWTYVLERANGATHEEAMALLAGRMKGPTAAESMRRHNEMLKRRQTIMEQDLDAQDVVDAVIRERGSTRGWMVGGEEMAGETASTGRIIRSIESMVRTMAEGGVELDVIVVSGDKAKLNQINQLVGRGYGDRALEAYRELFRRSVYEASGDGGNAFLIRPSGTGDEAVGIVIVKGGTGKAVHERLLVALDRNTMDVFAEYTDPGHPQSLAPVRDLFRDPIDLVGEVIDVSKPVSVRKVNGKVAALNEDGSNAMVTHRIEEGGAEVTEFLPKQVRTTDEQGSASHAPAMRKMLNSGVDTEIRKAPNISDVTESDVVSGRAFEIRLEMTDQKMLAEARILLPNTRKCLHETLTNAFGIRGFNTLLGHYGANHVVNVVEEAVGAFAAANRLVVRRLGTMKYIIEGGTPEQISALNTEVSRALGQNGMKFRAGNHNHVSMPLENASAADALASISNGHLRVEWGATSYENANALISAMAISNDGTLMKLLGGNYGSMRGIIEFVRKNRAIRNVEDLLVALRDPIVGGPTGATGETIFRSFIESRGQTFRTNMSALVPTVSSEAGVVILKKAVGAEETVRQELPKNKGGGTGPTTRMQPVDAATLENSIGTKPRSKDFEAVLVMLGSEEERRIARVLDAAMTGEIKGPLPPEYQRVLESIHDAGKGKAGAGVAAQERALIAASSVQDVIFNRSLIPLEKEMTRQGITGEIAEDAVLLIKARRSMPLNNDEVRRMDLNNYEMMEERIGSGMGESEAAINVAKEVNANYRKASGELEEGLGTVGGEAAAEARRILKCIHGRQMPKEEFDKVTNEQLGSVNSKITAGKTESKAIIETVLETNQQKLRIALLTDTFSRLVGFGKEDIKPLIGIIGKYEGEGYTFAGPMGSRLSFQVGGDYDLVFIGPRSRVSGPTVLQDKVGPRGTQVDVVLIPEDLRPTETTYIKNQPVAYPILMNTLAMNEQAVRLMAGLKAQVQPAQVAEWYVELSRSVLNIDGYERPDIWSSHGAEGGVVRHDFDVLIENSGRIERAAKAVKRCCLDFFPRAMYLREFNEFPVEAVAGNTIVYDNLLRQIEASNPELAQPLRGMQDLGLHIISAKLMSFNKNSSKDIIAEIASLTGKEITDVRVRDLEVLCPDGLSSEAVGRVRAFLSAKEKELPGKAPSITAFREFRVLVLSELRNVVGSLMKIALEKVKK